MKLRLEVLLAIYVVTPLLGYTLACILVPLPQAVAVAATPAQSHPESLPTHDQVAAYAAHYDYVLLARPEYSLYQSCMISLSPLDRFITTSANVFRVLTLTPSYAFFRTQDSLKKDIRLSVWMRCGLDSAASVEGFFGSL